MKDFPVGSMLLLLIAPIAVVLLLKRQKKLIAAGDKMYAKFRLGEIAQRMRLAIQDGDPGFNLMMAHAHHQEKDLHHEKGFLGIRSDDGTKESRAVLRGAPNGRPTEFVYFFRTDFKVGAFENTTTYTFECRLSMQVARPFAPFEVVLRNPAAGMESPPVLALPPVSFGDPLLDSKFVLMAADPRVGQAIAAALAPLANVGFLHIRACDQSVGYFATMSGSSMALYSIEQVQYALDQVAAILEGRSATSMAS